MIALLGAALADDDEVQLALRRSIATLREGQASNGCIPNNVDAESKRANFRAYADGGLWWILGSSILEPDVETTTRVLGWYECQDVDQSGLLSMQESADWQDLFCTRGKGLYLNCLYVLALEAAAGAADRSDWRERADLVRARINQYFWYRGDGDMLPHIAHTFSTDTPAGQDSLGRKRWLPPKRSLAREQYYLPYLAFRTPGEWFDVLGHLLAILSGVATGERADSILNFMERHKLGQLPAKSLYPPIQRGDADWRDYYGMLNVPHHYHNGGVWPFIGGFYVAALVHCGRLKDARAALARLADMNTQGEFNEWHHGETGEPMGVRDQAWSAGMYLFAEECVARERVLWLAR